uniref:Uncharacterized protein n=1 Tax=Physcomitrium patens TaxID=3218 RepID=A0A2K1IMR5_PHYPA|nr:hypothetical protein PHYPA_026883 [Physcomitrium patens]
MDGHIDVIGSGPVVAPKWRREALLAVVDGAHLWHQSTAVWSYTSSKNGSGASSADDPHMTGRVWSSKSRVLVLLTIGFRRAADASALRPRPLCPRRTWGCMPLCHVIPLPRQIGT